MQHWYKDMRHSTRVKDEEGHPAFALVNRATGLAVKHSLGQSHPVKLVPYNPEYQDESVLWTESKDVGHGFRCIRMVNNIYLNLDAFHGDKSHGGVHDGTTVVLWEWCKGDNQCWKILPWGPEAYAPPPPPAYGHQAYPPPPPNREPGHGYHPAPAFYPPQPPPSHDEPGYGYRPPPVGPPGAGYGNRLPRALASEPTVRILCRADEAYSLTVRNGAVCLAPTNPRDDFQHWVKDMRHSTSIKDEEGYPAFALVNKATGEAIKHSLGQSHPVRLVPYNPEYLDESVLWTESKDVGHGFRCVRMVNNIYLNFDAFHGDKDHGGVHDGTTVVLWEWCKGDNQRWKILPWWSKMFGFGHHHNQAPAAPSDPNQIFKIFCRANENYCLTVRDSAVVLAPVNPKDEHQHWFKDMRFSTKVKDGEGMPAFALVNKATGLAVKHSLGQSHPLCACCHGRSKNVDFDVMDSWRVMGVQVKLVPFNPEYEDASVLWTESKDVGKGFRCIRMVNNTRLNLDAFHGDKDHGGVRDGTTVVLWEWCKGDNQSWKILPWGPEAHSSSPGAATACTIGGVPVHTVRVFSAAGEDYCLTVRNGTACLAPKNPRDDYQHWIKDMRHSNKIRDEEGYPAFALVNKVTGEAIKHSTGQGHPVKLVPYNPEYQDESVLWTESKDVGKGFRCIRMVNNIYLNFDAFHGDKDHGGIHDGTEIVLWKWCEGDNQRWKILPWGWGGPRPPQPTVKVYCRANPNYAMTARNGAVVLAPANPKDEYQHWIKDMRWSTSIKDEEGYPAFALVNKATGQAIKHSLGQSHPVRLVPYNPEVMDESVLWTESRDVGNGFRCIRMVNNIYLNFDAFHGDKYHGGVRDGTDIVLWKWCEGDNQRWKIQPYY
uniref:Ricin B lectin domain-containing protein n=2 Tax=Oryza rufipogon TaxID=4529 RepID=A0A0E0QCV5_ORYRU